MKIDGIEVHVEGNGVDTVEMLHGWPDTHRLWDTTVTTLQPRWRCLRFTLPGFDLSLPGAACSLDEVVATLRHNVTQCCPGERVTLLVHDWGCVFGYQFVVWHPTPVSRIVGVDTGDAGSKAHRAKLGLKAKLMVLGYPLWLASAWRLGGALEAPARRPGSRVVGPRTGHWVMVNQPRKFNDEITRWLAETAAAP